MCVYGIAGWYKNGEFFFTCSKQLATYKNFALLQVMASVPDLITVLDSQSGSHLGTPECKYLGLTNEKKHIL